MLNKIKWFWRYYRKHKKVVWILLLMTPLQTLFQVTVPRMVGFTVDTLKTGETPAHWLAQLLAEYGSRFNLNATESFAVGFMVLGLVSHAIYAYFQSWRAWMNCRLEMMFRQEAFDGITAKGPDFFNRFRTGDLVTRMTDDVAEKLSWFACSGIFRMYEALLAVTFILIAMISIDPLLTFWTTLPLPLLILIFFKSSTILDKRYEHLQARISDVNDIMEACFSGIRVVKAYVRESAQRMKFAKSAEVRRDAEIETVKAMTVIDSLYNSIWQFGVVIVMVIGGFGVLYSSLSVGDMATFIYYVVWLVFPMFDIGQFLVKSRQSAVSIDRLIELEDVEPMVRESSNTDNGCEVSGTIRFDCVDFSFDGVERNIVHDISFTIEAGQTVALVGRVGSGKTWLINMIPRLVDPTGGSVKIGESDLKEFTLADLRRNIGYVPQEPVLFSDTIRNNILFGREGIDDELLNWAIDVAQLRTEIDMFPDGLETAIGTRGMSISGGQKQRLALARALVGKPNFLVLDDCTSALDSKTEADLWDQLHNVLPGMTAVLITHRPDTLEKVDNIYVLDNGQIVETGKHSELMKAEGLYARIYKRYQLEAAVG